MKTKNVLITGITGQTGSYLAELLIDKGYVVCGIKRRTSTNNTSNLSNIIENPNLILIEGDCLDSLFITDLIRSKQFDEIYHLAAQSHVWTSFQIPEYTTNSIYLSTLYVLEAIRKYSPQTKMYFSGSSEMFGKNYSFLMEEPNINNSLPGITKKYQDEETAFCPQSPYSIAKLAGFHLTRLYREAYGLYSCSGILFNHESPRRGVEFVTRKITKYCANIYFHHGSQYNSSIPKLKLGNLESYRDWGYAQDYADAIYKILQQDIPRDLVISTGTTYSIRQFLEKCFDYINVLPENINDFVEIDPSLYRPAEVDYLCGNSSLARKILNWKPTVDIDELIHIMIEADIKRLIK